jgi:hypothetical protein
MILWILFHLGILVFKGLSGSLGDLTLRSLGLGDGIFGSSDMLDIAVGSLLALLNLLEWLIELVTSTKVKIFTYNQGTQVCHGLCNLLLQARQDLLGLFDRHVLREMLVPSLQTK